jgi:hypothetical protein
VAKGFLISVAKEDPDPQLRCVALRAIANEPTVVQEFVVNGQHVQLAQDAMLQRMETYRKSLDAMNRLNEEGGTITLGRGPLPLPEGAGPKDNRFFVAPGPEQRFELRDQPPVFPKQFPEEPKVDPSPKPSPSVNE